MNSAEQFDEQFAAARAAFAEIQAALPWLETMVEPDAPVEISIRLPVQSGLTIPMWLGFQNGDELCLGIGGNFQVHWFPCTAPAKALAYVNATVGFVSGRYRLVEHYWRSVCVKAELQHPQAGGWQTLATCSNLGTLLPGRRTTRIVRNDAKPSREHLDGRRSHDGH